jgi:hypothetical protein
MSDQNYTGPLEHVIFDPIVPIIGDRTLFRELFARAYAEPLGRGNTSARTVPTPAVEEPPSLDGTVLLFDTETVDHRLTFGALEIYKHRTLKTRAVFYRDDLPTSAQKDFERLKIICTNLGVMLVAREWLFQYGIWPARRYGGTIAGFNLAYDLSRIADAFEQATKTGRLGSRFCNGFSFIKHFFGRDGKLQSPTFVRIKRDDRHHVRYDAKNAVILDLATWAFAYTDRNQSLASACQAFHVPFDERPGEHSGEVTTENVAGCLHDVRKTAELLWALDTEHRKHPIQRHPAKVQSGASIAKAYLQALGVRPRLDVQPDFPKPYLGYAAQAYFGGRVEARIIKTPVPCTYLDFLSMYPTVFALLGLWRRHVIPEALEIEEIAPAEIAERLARFRNNPDSLFDPTAWKALDFFALVDPNDSTLAVRSCIPRATVGYADAEGRASNTVVSIGAVESKETLWYAAPDLAAAAITGGTPIILRAWRLRPQGLLDTLTPLLFRSADPIDPRTDDFFTRLIELRKTKTGDVIDDERRQTGYKVVANSGAYGAFAETNPIDIDPNDTHTLRKVRVYAGQMFETSVRRPERHGRMNFFPTASLVTAGARLMLALGIYLVERAGGAVAYCDTDSLIVVSSRDGGFSPCENGPYRGRDGRRTVRVLSWREVENIRDRFSALNPYNRAVIPGSVLKLEDENFVEGDSDRRCELWCYAVSEKSYALFTLDEANHPIIRKYSSHVLGQYRSPVARDRHGWIVDAWKREIRLARGETVEPFPWKHYPAIAQLTISTWSVLQPYRTNERLRPFDFLAVGVMSRKLSDIASRPGVCCKEPRPASTLFADVADWKKQPWRCLRCGAAWDFERFPRLKTYGEVIKATLQGVERKRLCADGSAPTRGYTIPRPVCVESKTAIGKEVIVDPTDIDEGITAELLSATNVIEYQDPQERLDDLREAIRSIGIARIASTVRISERSLRRIVHQGVTPHTSTLTKLEAAMEKQGA